VKPKFAAEDLAVPKVLIFVPAGWSTAGNTQYASGIDSRRDLAQNRHLLVFEGQQNSKGFGAEPVLRHTIPVPSENAVAIDSFKFPKMLSWSEALDSALVCFDGQVLRVTVAELQGLAVLRKNYIYEKDDGSVICRTIASALFATADRETVHRIKLISRSEADPIPPDEQLPANFIIPNISNAEFDLEIESVDQHDNCPVKYVAKDIVHSDIYFPPLEINHISVSNNGYLTFGSLQFQLGFSSGKLNASKDSVFERATKAFTGLCHPFGPEASSFLEYFSPKTWKSSLTIFQKSNITFAEFLGDKQSTSNLFIPIVTKTCRDFLVVGQYSRMIDSGEVVSDILREAQCFEVYLTVFDERKGLTWMMNTTTAGPIIKFQASVPEIAWAMHPTEPLLAWILPGHRVRLSHINSSRHPLNMAGEWLKPVAIRPLFTNK
jgi:hypothetical protein